MPNDWKPGLNHIEFWASDLARSTAFYAELFELIGWKRLGERMFSSGSTEIYLASPPAGMAPVAGAPSYGPRHLCFQATSREMVDAVASFVRRSGVRLIRGPVDMPYTEGYYTVDFADPDGVILEVAHTPNMKL